MGKPIIEGTSELLVGKGLREVLFRQQPGPDCTSHRCSQPSLVLGDGALEQGQPTAEDLRGLVRMEKHPDGHSIREAPGKGSKDHHEDGLKKLFGHGQCCR